MTVTLIGVFSLIHVQIRFSLSAKRNGSVNSKYACQPPCYLVSPGGGEFVRKPLPGGEAFINISLKNMPPYR